MNKLISSLFLLVSLYSFQSGVCAEWASLDSETQKVLRQFENEWDRFGEARQARLVLGAQRWIGMDKEQRDEVSKRYQRWQQLSSAKRKELSQRYGEFGKLSVEERRLLREQMQTFKHLPKVQQDKLRDKFRRMTREDKARALERLKRRSRALQSPREIMSDKHRRGTDVPERKREKDTAGDSRPG